MQKIVLLMFVALAYVAVVTSGGSVTVTPPASSPSMDVPKPNSTATATTGMYSSSPGPTITVATKVTTPISGVVNLKAFAGIVFSFVLIALF